MTEPTSGGTSDEPTPPHGEPASGAVPPWDPAAERPGAAPETRDAPQESSWAAPGGSSTPGGASMPPPGQGPPPAAPYGSGAPFGSGSPYGGPALAPKPGVVPLRPLGVGEVLDGAVSYIRAHPKVVLGVSAVVAVISQLVQVPLQVFLVGGATQLGNTPDFAQLTGLLAGAAAGGFVGGLITLVATAILTGILMVVISRSVLGAPVDAGETWRAARPRVPGLIGLVLLLTLIGVLILAVGAVPGLLLLLASEVAGIIVIVVGVLAAIVVLVWVSVSLSLAAPAYVLEGVGVIEALRRSWRLVSGRFWPVLGIQLLAAIIAGVLASIIAVPFSVGASLITVGAAAGGAAPSAAMSLPAVLITAVGGIIALTITAPFQSGVTGLLYVDQRMRSEGFDIELQRAAAAAPR